eukprot:4396873-Pyramimonas_sp.AAC.1
MAKMSVVLSSLAWNHRRCSFRNSRVTTLGSRLREFCKLACASNQEQSGSLGREAGFPSGGGG